jgi:predicted component of viral defense system (DUF524 family)
VTAEWSRSGAGHYSVRLATADGHEEQRFTIVPAKLSASSFATLVSDLEARLPAAVAIGLQRVGGLTGLTVLPPEQTTVAQELARLRRAVRGTPERPGLVQVLSDLAPDPHRVLRVDDLWVRRERARRPHPAQLIRAVVLPHNVEKDGLPRRVIDRRIEPTVDTFENRLVRLFYEQVRFRLRRLARQLGVRGDEAAFAAVREMHSELRLARRQAAFLDDVALSANLPTQVTMVLLKRPAYRAALAGFLGLHRSLAVRLEDPRLEAPLENLPALYQLWGTMMVIDVLLEVAVQHRYRLSEQRLVHPDGAGAFVRVMPAGHAALALRHPDDGTEIRLISERSFGNSGPLRSISYLQVPDVTIEVVRSGTSSRLFLFDPKYKLAGEWVEGEEPDGKPNKVDIDKMHAYRDAIRDEEDRRVVECAATLCPGPSVRFAPGIEAIQGVPGRADVLEARLKEILEAAISPW